MKAMILVKTVSLPEGRSRQIQTRRPVVVALSHLEPGGRVIVNAISKIDADKDWLLTPPMNRVSSSSLSSATTGL